MSDAKGLRGKLIEYGDTEFAQFLRNVFVHSGGLSHTALDRPVVGILDTGATLNSCHGNAAQLIEAAKRGVLMNGGFPAVVPTMSIHESFSAPTSMYLRNLMAMCVEESIRAQPLDAVILIGGCDKTVPALLMGAASAGVPAICLVTGPMLAGAWQGTRVGACSDCRAFWGKYRAGAISSAEVDELQSQLAPTAGTCGVMGTASTMALATEAMGMMLPGGASAPAVSADRLRIAEATGARAAELANAPITPAEIMTPEAFENAFRIVLAAGGSTNALIHLTAVAGRLGIAVDLPTIDKLGRETPVLVDVKPAGTAYMEDFYRAGGLAPVLRELEPHLNTGCLTITGHTLGEVIRQSGAGWQQSVIRPASAPLQPAAGLIVLQGNLAPDGAVMKPAAASADLLEHSGRAVVFDGLADLALRIDSDDLDVEPGDVLVLKNAGPVGGSGMPEAGYLPIPRKLAQRGVKDMLRISDARMSGTAFGAVVLHAAPEAAVGGPLAVVRSGDTIRLSASDRTLTIEISDDEMRQRMEAFTPLATSGLRGYARLFRETVMQADKGCDLAFARPEITRSI